MVKPKVKRPSGATAAAFSGKVQERHRETEKEEKDKQPIGAPTSEQELDRKTKSQEKNKRKREKKKRETAEKTVVQNFSTVPLPDDPSVKAREEKYEQLVAALKSTPALSSLPEPEILLKKDEIRANLNALDKEVHSTVVQQLKETRKPEERGMTPEDIMEQIVRLQKDASIRNPGASDPSMAYYEHQLRLAVGWKNCKKFQEKMNQLRKDIQKQKEGDDVTAEHARLKVRKERIIERVRELKLFKYPDLNMMSLVPNDTDITTTAVDLTPEAVAVLYGAPQLARKLERNYGAVVDRLGGSSRRTIHVSGMQDDVLSIQRFLRAADFSGKFVVKVADNKVLAQVIGSRGVGVKKIEEQFNCFIHVEGNIVNIFGSKEDAATVQQSILNSKINSENTEDSADFEIPGYLAKALNDLAGNQLRDIDENVTVKVRTFKNSRGNLFIRGKAEAIEPAKKKVNELLEKFTSVKFRLSPQSVQRLLHHQKPYGFDSEYRSVSRQILEEFHALKETSRCSFSRDPDDESILVMVGTPEDVQRSRGKIESVVLFASLDPSEVIIRQPQLRYFDLDNRSLVMSETGVRLVVGRPNAAGEVAIEVLGTDDQITHATQMINEIMERDAFMKEYEFLHSDTIGMLKRNKGQRLLEMQSAFGVFINIDQKLPTSTIVGSKVGVEDTIRALLKADEEAKNRTSKTISIDPSHIRVVLGKGGSTIQSIRGTSGIDSINVQDEDATITMKGSPEAISVAENLIKHVCEEAAERQSPENRNRANAASPTAKAQSHTARRPAKADVFNQEDPDSFPPLKR